MLLVELGPDPRHRELDPLALPGGCYADMQRMEEVLRGSDASWISLRPPRLIDKPATEAYRIGLTPPRGGRSVRWGEFATALLDALDQPEFFRTAPYVSN